jgi:uncharacterized protein YndB with AHSA1/START domain
MPLTETATWLVQAAPVAVHAALTEPAAVAAWLPPVGMTVRIDAHCEGCACA